ncbi:MAG: hypothetical protein AABX47_10395 [Nanoarchaeota archaeon]
MQSSLRLEENWDGEGSLPVEVATALKAKEYIRMMDQIIKEKWEDHATPQIGPGPDRSIDSHWKSGTYEVLLNVPSNDGLPTYFGIDQSGSQMKGQLSPPGRYDGNIS